MPAGLIASFESIFGVPVVEGYGLSECTVAATINPPNGIRKPGTVGIALPGIDIAIDTPDGPSSLTGRTGEVLVSGQTVMQGYLGLPDVTAKTIREGWLHTGDAGYLELTRTLLAAVGLGLPGVWGGALYYLLNSTLAASAFFLLIDMIERWRNAGVSIAPHENDGSAPFLAEDLTAHAQAGIGSVVELWGSAPTLSELAPRCGVSAYQLPCAVKRVAKVYV